MFDVNSGKPHPVTIAAREKLAAEESSLSTDEWARRLAAIEHAQKVACNIERREARARAQAEQVKATSKMRSEQRKPFAALRLAQMRARGER